jgi:quercetin dioxygenase-like cupin family protein
MSLIAPFVLAALAPVAAAPADGGPDIHVDVPANARNLEVNVVEHDLAPGQSSGWHIHHGTEIAYVLSGAINMQIAGGPIRHASKGETFVIDPETPHNGTNASATDPVALLITYVKKKGPVSVPVQRPSPQ